MGLKEEVLDLDGVKIKVQQLSFAAQMRLDVLGEGRTFTDIYNECVEDPKLLEQITTQQGVEVVKAINRVNGWDKGDEEKDFPESHSKKESGT